MQCCYGNEYDVEIVAMGMSAGDNVAVVMSDGDNVAMVMSMMWQCCYGNEYGGDNYGCLVRATSPVIKHLSQNSLGKKGFIWLTQHESQSIKGN